jgi:hypothetical protein
VPGAYDGEGFKAHIGVEPDTGLIAACELTAAFTQPYRQHRARVERSVAWLIRRGGRKVCYRGIARNRIGLTPLRRDQPAPPHQPRPQLGQRLEGGHLNSGPGADK